MGGLYTPFKDFLTGAILTAADLDALQAYLITQHVPAMIDDYSATVSEMQTMLDPGELGTEAQAGSLAAEIAQLRKLISEITGRSQWYQSPNTSLAITARTLNRQSIVVGTDANTTEKVLATYTLPANTLTATPQAIRIRAAVNNPANGNTKTTRIRLGGLTGPAVCTLGPAVYPGINSYLDVTLLYATDTSTVGPAFFNHTGLNGAFYNSTTVAAWSAPQDIVLTGQNGTPVALDIVARFLETSFLGGV